MFTPLYGVLDMEKFVEKQQKMVEEATRRHIFEAVIRATQKGNTSDFTMQQVADEAGMAIGTLYNYFENKNTLLIYVFRRLLEVSQERCDAAASKPGLADRRLEQLLAEFLKFGREYVILFRLFDLTGLRQQLPEEEKEKHANQDIERIRAVLIEGIREGVFREMDALLMARILFACLIGSFVTQPIVNELSPKQLSRELMRLVDA